MKKFFIRPKTSSSDPFHILDKKPQKQSFSSLKTKVISGQFVRKIGANSPSKASLIVVALISGVFGGYFIFQSFAAVPTQPAALGVYTGPAGVQAHDSFSASLGRDATYAIDFADDSQPWENIANYSDWMMDPWSAWVKAKADRRLVVSLPMLNQASSGQLAEGANGKFDQYFRTFTQELISKDLGNSVIRLGWEANGDWYPWKASTNPEAWKAYYQRIVGIMRSTTVAGKPAPNFKFDWTMNLGTSGTSNTFESLYPGDDVVDIIGLDAYDVKWMDSTSTPEVRWNHLLNQKMGLNEFKAFAAAHNKPMSIPEWGLWPKGTNDGGGGDNPYYIDRMADWMVANKSILAYQSYFNHLSGGADGDHRLSSYPNSHARFNDRFKATTTSSTTPASLTLKLINADTDQVISNMTNGMTIDLKTARNLNIDASANVPIESVRFDDNGQIKIESFPPYAIGEDGGTNSTDYFPWTPTVGNHTLTVKAYSADGASGTELVSTTVSFTVTDTGATTTPPPTSDPSKPFGDAASLKNWALQTAGSDEFNGTSLDLAKWSPTWLAGDTGNGGYSNAVNGFEIQCFHTGQTTVNNGTLKLKTASNSDSRCKKQDGSNAAYKSGIITSKKDSLNPGYETAYGYFEARINAASIDGNMVNWPAFWTVGAGLKWPDLGEIDILEELGGGTPCWHYHYRDANGVHQGPGGCIPRDTPWSGWHTYAAYWEPGKITFFYDGKQVGVQTQGVVSVPHFIVLLHAMDGTPYIDKTMEVDYIRVWKDSGGVTTPTPPTLSINNLSPNQIVKDGLPVGATASAGNGISKVEFYLDNSTTPIATELSSPYCLVGDSGSLPCNNWDSKTVANGSHTLKVIAYDNSSPSLKSEASVSFTVDNTTADAIDPIVSIKFPPADSPVSGILTSEAIAYDPPSTTNGSGITKVDFYVDNTAATGTPRMSINTTSPASYKYTLNTAAEGLSNGFHNITARAYDNAGNSSTANVRVSVFNSDTEKPSAPSNLRLNGAVTATSVSLAWNAATDNVGVVKYNVLRDGVVIGSTTGLSYTDPTNNSTGNPGPSANSTYQYSVQAVDAANNTSLPSSPALPVTTPSAPDSAAPSTPSSLSASAISSSQINLAWNASTDTGGSGLAGYNIYRGTSSGSITTKVNTSLVTGTSFGDSLGLNPNTDYFYQLEAVDGAGNPSARSNTASAKTQQLDLTLKLINADTDQVISNMTNGMTIDLKNARNLNIDATASGTIESVQFNDNGQVITESFPPYAIGQDSGTNSTDYYPWTPSLGSHTLTVKAYSADGATGTELASTTISFNVVDGGTTTNPPPPDDGTNKEAEELVFASGTVVINDTSASNSKAIRFYTDGTASGQVNLGSSASKITVRAKGDQCSGAPRMTVKVDGVQVQSTAVSASDWTDYTVATSLTSGSHSLSIAFSEDHSQYAGKSNNLKCSRDLYVDKITFFRE